MNNELWDIREDVVEFCGKWKTMTAVERAQFMCKAVCMLFVSLLPFVILVIGAVL